MARMHQFYKDTVMPELQQKFGYKSVMEIPRITKITLNMGVGEAVGDKKILDHAVGDMTKIAGQKPVVTKAKKAIAGFKIREGYPIGVAVTLRGPRMWEFVDRLISLAIPRIRDFRGVPSKLDGRGNYTMGLSEQSVFPEIQLDKVEFVQGMDITFVTTAGTDKEGLALLAHLGIPFRK